MRLACTMCGTWSVSFSSSETWVNDAAGECEFLAEFLAGRCDRCDSRVLTEPSASAVETARVRLAVMRDAMRTAARQETLPAVSASEDVILKRVTEGR